MGILNNRKEGGAMDVIRCDEQEYLIWKWRPSGDANSTKKENSVRWGSSLRVKDGEVAVFRYNQKDGPNQDYIIGPHDDIIKTANFPVITSIIGLAYAGKSPFQAEIYFINLAQVTQVNFGIPYFDLFDPRYLDFGVPCAVRGKITFFIEDYKNFIKLHRLINFQLQDFLNQVRDTIIRYTKATVVNIPIESGIPVVQIERKIEEINDLVFQKLKPAIENDFGVFVKRIDISAIELDKESNGYRELRKITAEITSKTVETQTEVNLKNLKDMQGINAQNIEETLRVQREEAQRRQRLQSETDFINAHQVDQQAEVLKKAAEGLSEMGNMNLGSGEGGMNPAGMMTGMMMGGAVGGQMANMMNNMGSNFQKQQNTPPPPPVNQYHISLNGQQAGPFTVEQLQQMIQSGQVNRKTYLWKPGFDNWIIAEEIKEIASLFNLMSPPPPPTTK
jgi:membrane protease subunit (stomatin/prohibitin family)